MEFANVSSRAMIVDIERVVTMKIMVMLGHIFP